MTRADAEEWLRRKVKKRIEWCRLPEAERVERLCEDKRTMLLHERIERRAAERKAAQLAALEPAPYLETVDARSAGLELLQCLEESSSIVLAEGVRLPDETDWLGLKEEIARQTLDLRVARMGRHPWWHAWKAWESKQEGEDECR